ncbi:MAG: zinc-binding dehydrogenase [Gemmataceae bacterium]
MSGIGRAMVFDGPGKPLRPVEVPLPTPGPGEVLVRVEMCTLCGSDLHTYFGRRSGPTPVVLGHEIIGQIERLPEQDIPLSYTKERLSLGDRVIWSIATSCSNCFFCRHDLPQKCERGSKYGHTAFAVSELSGGLATHCLLRAGTTICRVPERMPAGVACPAGCATATVAATFARLGPSQDESMLIFGAGMLGLTASAYAKASWSGAVLVIDPDEGRRRRARLFGANRAELPENLDVSARDIAGPHGFDCVIDMSGAEPALKAGLTHVRTGGRIAWVGSVFPGPPVPVSAESLVRKELSLFGVHNYRPADLVSALSTLALNQLTYPFADLVSATFPLDRADDAFHVAATGEHVRVAVLP